MVSMVLCAILISLSGVFYSEVGEDNAVVVDAEEEKQLPVWVAVVSSFAMPIALSLYVPVIKHSNEKLNIAAYDFTIANWGVMSLAYQIVGIVSFRAYPASFDLIVWVNGTLASLLNLMASIFAISCWQSGAPIGSSSALMSMSTVLMVIIQAIMD